MMAIQTKTQAYTYTGPLSSVTLRVEGKEVDVLLNPKKPVRLPPAHEFTQVLLAQKRLVAIEAPASGDDAPAGAPGADEVPASDAGSKPRKGGKA